MKRRDFLGAAAALSAVAAGRATAATVAELASRLGQTWAVPAGAHVELWPNQYGLNLAGLVRAIGAWTIVPGSRVTIHLPDGDHPQARSLDITHPHGQRLFIIGNLDNPERCRLSWQGPTDGLYCGAGATLGRIDGVLFEHAAPAARGLGSALLADLGGSIICGQHVVVRNFYYSCQARYGGVIRCPGLASSGAGDAGFFAFNGGHLFAEGAQASGARDGAQGLGSGFVAEYGGTINASGALAEKCLLAGFTALSNGVIRAHRALAQNNVRAGFYADTGGTIVAHDALARGNCGAALLSPERAGAISGQRMRIENNGAGAPGCVAAR